MRIVYFGTAPFAVPALEALSPHVVLVVSQPDRPSGRGMKFHPSAVKSKAMEFGIPIAAPIKCRAQDFVDEISALEADFLMVAAYGQILPASLLEAAIWGAFNLHGSILPKYRGAAPIQRAVEAGDEETGVSLMQMDKGMDTGDVIDIARTPIRPDETYGELADRLAYLGAQLALNWAPKLCIGEYPRFPQNHEDSSHAPKIEKSESELKFDREGISEYRKFRAFTPSPGAFLRTRFGSIKISRSNFDPLANGLPGTILNLSPELAIAFGSGSIVLKEIQPEGKARMSGRDWANGHRLQVGMNLRPE